MDKPLPALDQPTICPDPEAGFGALETSKGPLPLKALDVQAHILGLITRVNVSQTFVNTHREPLEAVYIFPLPPRAAVSRFTMHIGDRLVVGKLFEREEARQKYSEALQEGKRAALAEEDRSNVFTLSVGNLMPGDVAEISFEMVGLLALEGNEAVWRFPLVVAPRYIPGTPLDVEPAGLGSFMDTDLVPDASRLNPPLLLPGYPNPVRLGIEVDWDSAGLPISNIRSSLHSVIETQVEGKTRIRLAESERVDRDFILRCQLQVDEVWATAVLAPDGAGHPAAPDGSTGTLMVTLLPPSMDPAARPGRDVVFLLDRSGSMDGWKIAAARRAMAFLVDSLGPEDRFEVIRFQSNTDSLGKSGTGLIPATDQNRFRATQFLAQTSTMGGTEMGKAVKKALDLMPQPVPGREAIIFLVTDGQVGDEDRILQMIGKERTHCRFQILGIDEAVNESLLKRLADSTGGWFLASESEKVLDGVLLTAARKFGSPLITGISLHSPDLKGVGQSLVSSGNLDLYPGTPLVLLARHQEAPDNPTISIAGDSGAPKPFNKTYSARTVQEPALRSIWSRFRIRELEDVLAHRHQAETVQREITELSLAFGVLCRFTAFLAVDESAVVNPDGRTETIIQPVELPRGWANQSLEEEARLMCCLPMLCCPISDPEIDEPGFGAGILKNPVESENLKHSLKKDARAISEAFSMAKALMEFLNGLPSVSSPSTETFTLPEAFFKLLLLLEGMDLSETPLAKNLYIILLFAKKMHTLPVQGNQPAIRQVVIDLNEALEEFIKVYRPNESSRHPDRRSKSPCEGSRKFWKQ